MLGIAASSYLCWFMVVVQATLAKEQRWYEGAVS